MNVPTKNFINGDSLALSACVELWLGEKGPAGAAQGSRARKGREGACEGGVGGTGNADVTPFMDLLAVINECHLFINHQWLALIMLIELLVEV